MNKFLIIIFLVFGFTGVFAQVNEQKFKLAESYEKSGDFENASRLYKELLNSDITQEPYFEGYVRSMKAMNRFSDMIPIVKDRLEKVKNVPTYALLGELYWRIGKTSDANDTWEECIKLFEKRPEAYQFIAQTQVSLQLYDKAIKLLKDGRDIIKDKFIFSDLIIKLFIATGNYKEGLPQIYEVFVKDYNLAQAQGRIYALMSSDEANKFIESYLNEKTKQNFNNLMIIELYAWFLRSVNKFEESLDLYVRMDELKNARGGEIYRFAEDSRRDGQYEIAQKAYSKLIDQGRSQPYSQAALYGYARTMEAIIESKSSMTINEANDLIDRYRSIIKDYPGSMHSAESRLRIANLAENILKDYKLAETEYSNLFKERQFPNLASQAGLTLANLYIKNLELEKAEKLYRNIIIQYKNQLHQESLKAEYGLADLLYYNGNADSASTLYRILSKNTESDVANDALNKYVFIETNKQLVKALNDFAKAELNLKAEKYDEAISLFRQISKEQSGEDIAELSLKNMIEIENKRKNYKLSADYAEELLKDYPESIYGDWILMTIADNYTKMNDKQTALKYYNDILIKYPRSIYLTETRKKIRFLRDEKL